jgi:Fe-S cluster assembly scaffold protein SufB
MKSAKNVYHQVNEIAKILEVKGVKVLRISEAWEKYRIVKEYFEKKPKDGFFLWIKKQINFPISTCLEISKEKFKQKIANLTLIEKGIKAKALMLCSALKKDLNCYHLANGFIILRKNASLEVKHFHNWNTSDKIQMNYNFLLEKNSYVNYIFKSFNPGNVKFNTFAELKTYAKFEKKVIMDSKNSDVNLNSIFTLNGVHSSVISTLKVVARNESKVIAVSKLIGKEQSRGHLECQGLLIGKKAKINLTPSLIVENRNALLTHEASIGKISEDELNYLRSRGLNEEEAIELLITGFLSE